MTYATSMPQPFVRFDGSRPLRRRPSRTRSGTVALVLAVMAGAFMLGVQPTAAPDGDAAPKAQLHPMAHLAAKQPAAGSYLALLDAGYSLGPPPASFDRMPLLGRDFVPASPPLSAAPMSEAELEAPAPTSEPDAEAPAPLSPLPQVGELVPVPVPRPTEIAPPPGPFRQPGRRFVPETRTAALPVAPDNRNFIEKLFGLPRPPGSVLGYAAPEDPGFGGRGAIAPVGPYDRWTAVYDISAHTVYMPDGARLEAHSGLGDRLDDPRHVNERMRGATPPNLYDLQPREQLFHGVQALRLNPVGGGTFGRTGLLAHTFMLGPNGDSNGCVSFRNYNAFLQAYMRGEIRRLAVVARM